MLDDLKWYLTKEKFAEACERSKIWAVGTVLGENWMAESLHWDELAAAKSAKPGQFIVLCPIGEDFPAEATDAEKLYYPNEERWEDSVLYTSRQDAAGWNALIDRVTKGQ